MQRNICTSVNRYICMCIINCCPSFLVLMIHSHSLTFSTLSAKSPLSCTSMYTFSSTAASVPTLGQTNTCISSELPVTCSSSTCVFSTSASVPTSVVPEQTHFSPTYKSSSPNPTFMASATSSTYQVPFVRLPYQSAVTSQTPPTPVVLTSTSDSSISSHHLDISSSTFPPSTEAHSLPSSLKHPESERSFRLAPPVLRFSALSEGMVELLAYSCVEIYMLEDLQILVARLQTF